MKFTIKTKDNIIELIRRAGYHLGKETGAELSFARRIGGNQYPQFHIYLKQDSDKYFLNLHLDQKKPSYQGSHAHNAEYDGELVANEAERIKAMINNIS